jgi:hypothetical protein
MNDAHPATDSAEQSARGVLAQIAQWQHTCKVANLVGDEQQLEEVHEQAREYPLSLAVRDGWHAVGDTAVPEEAEILLCTGGPAVRLLVSLDGYCEPDALTLQCQDWFTPWRDVATSGEEYAALLWFAGLFFYGEG